LCLLATVLGAARLRKNSQRQRAMVSCSACCLHPCAFHDSGHPGWPFRSAIAKYAFMQGCNLRVGWSFEKRNSRSIAPDEKMYHFIAVRKGGCIVCVHAVRDSIHRHLRCHVFCIRLSLALCGRKRARQAQAGEISILAREIHAQLFSFRFGIMFNFDGICCCTTCMPHWCMLWRFV